MNLMATVARWTTEQINYNNVCVYIYLVSYEKNKVRKQKNSKNFLEKNTIVKSIDLWLT